MKSRIILASLMTLLLLGGGCAPTPTPTPAPVTEPPAAATAAVAPTAQPVAEVQTPADVAATVNGQPIAMATYQAQLQTAIASYSAQPGFDAKSDDGKAALAALRSQVLDWLIDQELIDQAAKRMGITVTDADVDAEVQRIKNDNSSGFADWLKANGFTEDSFRTQTRSDLLGAKVRDEVTKGVPTQAEQVHLRQILVETQDQANDILTKLRQGAGTFESLAKQYSQDNMTAQNGGDMGWVPRGVLAESVEQAAFALQPGQISNPVQSPLGWHLLQVEERAANRDISPDILANLRQQAFMKWLETERAKADIKRYVKDS